MTIPGIMSLEYRAMLLAAAEFDRLTRARGWLRGKACILGPSGERLPPDISDRELARYVAASQNQAVGVKDLTKAA